MMIHPRFLHRSLKAFAAAVLLIAAAAQAADAVSTPLPAAHAHNDYWHDRPLLDAIDHGFCNVEADIFLVDGELLVGHDRSELKPERTLSALYLEPLRQRVEQNGGRVYPDGPEFTLLIDIKTGGRETYEVLDRVLSEYSGMLVSVIEGEVNPGAVRAVISGNRAHDVIDADSSRYAGIDGRLSDLDSEAPSHLLPLISDNWRLHFRWRGEGPMPEAERNKLHSIVQRAHDRGRRVRFWATPESETLWAVLDEAGVDMINTDELARLEKFLRTQQP